MSKYTFICEYTDIHGKVNGDKITYETTQETLSSVLESFEQFLRGAGFYFDGNLDFVSDRDFMQLEEEEEEPRLDEPDEWTQVLRDDNEWPFASNQKEEMYESMDVMQAPGTIGGAKIVFPDTIKPVESLDTRCPVCNLTRHQLGDNMCYEPRCGLKS